MRCFFERIVHSPMSMDSEDIRPFSGVFLSMHFAERVCVNP